MITYNLLYLIWLISFMSNFMSKEPLRRLKGDIEVKKKYLEIKGWFIECHSCNMGLNRNNWIKDLPSFGGNYIDKLISQDFSTYVIINQPESFEIPPVGHGLKLCSPCGGHISQSSVQMWLWKIIDTKKFPGQEQNEIFHCCGRSRIFFST